MIIVMQPLLEFNIFGTAAWILNLRRTYYIENTKKPYADCLQPNQRDDAQL